MTIATEEYPNVETETTEQTVEDRGIVGKEEETPQGQVPGQKPVNGNFNPDEWQLKYRDQTIKPKDRDHLVNLAQQGFSYSQRMHELKTREEQMEKNAGRFQQYEKLEKAFESNPQFRDQIFQWYNQSFTPAQQQKQQQQVQQESGSPTSIPPELLQEIASLKEWKLSWEAQQAQEQASQADAEVLSEIDGLKKKYARDDWDTQASNGMTLSQEIIKHALDNGGIKLETAYRDLMWDSHVKTTEAEIFKKADENKKASAKAGFVAGGKSKGAQQPKEVSQMGMNYDDVEKLIKTQYNITS